MTTHTTCRKQLHKRVSSYIHPQLYTTSSVPPLNEKLASTQCNVDWKCNVSMSPLFVEQSVDICQGYSLNNFISFSCVVLAQNLSIEGTVTLV